jgi:magnesium transporter
MLTRYVQRHLTWVDLISPTPSEVRSLMDEFSIDPSFANELLTSSYKPKVERRGELIYVILHFPLLRGMGKVPEEEIDFLIGKNFLITARYAQSDPLHSFAKAFEVNQVLGHHATATHGGHLFAAMARNLYQALGDECDILERHLSDIEEHIFNSDERSMVVRLSQTGRIIHDFRQRLIPHKEMLSSLEPQATRMFGPEFVYYIRTIEGDYQRVRTILENLREALIELRETNNSLLSTKQNETIKTFTVIAFFFLPLSFIAALFSMHTSDTPLVDMQGGFWIVLGVMALLAAVFFVYFKRKGWL